MRIMGIAGVRIRAEVDPFVAAGVGIAVALAAGALGARWEHAAAAGAVVGLVLVGFFAYFFRDPERVAPADPDAIVAGADGYIMGVVEMDEPQFLKTRAVRVSIFLTLFDVHVNRAPIRGVIRFLGYFPGRRFFTFQEKSSDFNSHSSILIEGPEMRCLVNQIVGPVARRIVYWLELGQRVAKGERIGMMKFGSRLDMYFPAADVEVVVEKGQKTRAGETVVARRRHAAGA